MSDLNQAAPVVQPQQSPDSDAECFARAKSRGQLTFTVVEQDISAPETICYWIGRNILTAPPEKLRLALDRAIAMRDYPGRKHAD